MGEIKDKALGELIGSLKNGKRFALFVGAGISVNSGIPSSSGVIQYLRTRYPEKFQMNHSYNYSEAFNIALPGKEHKADRRQLIEKLCAGKLFSEEHRLIAQLVEHRKFQIVLSTNFDHLTEIALTAYCSLQPKIYLFNADIVPRQYPGKFPKLLKLHGDFLFDDLANLDTEMKHRLNENMHEKIFNCLQNSGLIVLGYGGNDKTIMTMLEKAAQTPEGMKHGLWWVIHNEKERNNQKLIKLINKIHSQGKHAQIIGPTDAVNFLKTLCFSLNLDFPKPIPFGINPKRKNAVGAYRLRFGKTRQLPPIASPGKLGNELLKVLNELENALKTPGILWLVGPPRSGKTLLVRKLFDKIGPEKLFYFSHRFSENPIHSNFDLELEEFTNSLDVSTVKRWEFEDIVASLFKRDAILVFDDLFPKSFEMRKRILKKFIDIIGIQAKVGCGNIILVSSSEPSDEALIEIHHGMLEKTMNKEAPFCMKYGQVITCDPITSRLVSLNNKDLKSYPSRNMISFWPQGYNILPKIFGIHSIKIPSTPDLDRADQSFKDSLKDIYKKSKPEIKQVLRIMSLLRLAEYPSVLEQCTQIHNIDVILEKLVENGLAEKQRAKYMLRDSVQAYLYKLVPKIEDEEIRLAETFENLSREPLESYFNSFSHLIEAENLYYGVVGNFVKAAKIGIAVANKEIESRDFEIAFSDLLDFLQLEANGEQVISKLKPEEQIGLLIAFRKAGQGVFNNGDLIDKIKAESAMFYTKSIVNKTIKNLPRAMQNLFKGQIACESGKFNDGIKYLLRAEKTLSKKGASQTLANVQNILMKAFIQKNAKESPGNRKNIEQVHKWARAELKTYLSLNDQKRIAFAIDNVATSLLDQGKYKEALDKMEKVRDTIVEQDGFTRDKGVIYGNMFLAYLYLYKKEALSSNSKKAKEYLKKAEGYFSESNINFAYVPDLESLAKNLVYLFKLILEKKSLRIKGKLPSPPILYQWIYTVWNWSPYKLFYLMQESTILWNNYNLKYKHFSYTVSSLKYFFELTNFLFYDYRDEEEAIFMVLYYLTLPSSTKHWKAR